MSESKHSSKLSAMAADYYPTAIPPEFSNPMMAYSRNYAFGTFHPGAAQLSPQLPPPFVLHSTTIPQFQSPFMYIRPAFVDGLPMNAMHPFQPSPEHLSAELPRNNMLINNKQPHAQRTRPKSAKFCPQQDQHYTSEVRESESAAKSRKKKKKPKTVTSALNDLNDALADVSLTDRSSAKAFSSVVPNSAASQSYSDVLKRPPPAQPVSKVEEKEDTEVEEETNNTTLLNSIVEEFPSLDASKQQRAQSAKVPAPVFSQQQQHRGVLYVPSGAIDGSNHSTRQSNSFKLNLASLSPDVSNQPKKQKSNSSSRPDNSGTPEQNTPKQSGGNKSASATPKKNPTPMPEASPATSIDSPDRKPKYSKLKKVILEERKKRQQHTVDGEENEVRGASALPDTGSNSPEHDIETTAESNTVDAPEVVSPIQSSSSKSSPPKSTTNSLGNVCNAYLSSALSGLSKEDADAICRRLHRRRFREYCNQVLGAALDDSAYVLLTALGTFQQRQYEQNPVKAKQRRRYVCGLREAVKHIQLSKAKCIILAPNIERIPGKGGLDDMISLIISQCALKNVPVVFALGRVALGRACSKPSPVSSVAIISAAGAEEKFKQTLDLAQRAHESYVELVKMAVAEQLEQREQSSKNSSQPEKMFSTQSSGGAHVQFPPCHQLGHSRNASNISAISFISNISAVSDNSVGLNNMPSTASADEEGKNDVPSCDESDKGEDGEDVEEDVVEDGDDDFQEDDEKEGVDIKTSNDTV